MIHAEDQKDIVASWHLRGILGTLKTGTFHEIVDEFIGNAWGMSRGLFLGMLFVGMMAIFSRLIPDFGAFALGWLLGTLPLWLPPAAIIGGWRSWQWYARSNYIFKQEPVLLEIKMPRNIMKSPKAMEAVLTQLWTDSGETTFFNRFYQGQVRPYFSLEIASFGGDVHFYIWGRKGWRHVIEHAMYGQYPEIEIEEVEDYASKFKYDPNEVEVFCTDWRYEPHNDAHQIRTYVELELEDEVDEEYKIDPYAQVLEVLSSCRPGEQMWIQIIITLCRDQRHAKGTWFDTEDRFKGVLMDEIDKIKKETLGDPEKEGEEWRRYVRIQQYRQTEEIRAIDRNMGKLPFIVGSRGVYIAPPDIFNSGSYTALRWIWRPYANPQWGNQMRPRRWHNPFDYPWQDLWDMRWKLAAKRFFDVYRRRSHFYSPWVFPHNMMSTEPIATLWHPPSIAVQAPGLERIEAKKAEPPPNLPFK